MATRRVLEALPPMTGAADWRLAHDSAGLLGALLAVACVGLVLADRRHPRPVDPRPPSGAVRATGIAAAREEEREVLSYDLHDGLAQYVLAA